MGGGLRAKPRVLYERSQCTKRGLVMTSVVIASVSDAGMTPYAQAPARHRVSPSKNPSTITVRSDMPGSAAIESRRPS